LRTIPLETQNRLSFRQEIDAMTRDCSNRRRFIGMIGIAAVALAIASPQGVQAADTAKVKVGIIGSGNVGSALGTSLAKAGHSVMFSSRNLANDKALAAKVGTNASAGTPEQAAAFGEVLIFAVPYRALPDLGKTLASQIKGKVLIDACNPYPSRDGDIANWAREKGSGLASAELLPGARIVRAFNAVGAARMGEAREQPGRFGMPIASDDAQAAEIASRLIRDIGYEPVLIGGLDKGKHLIPGSPLAGERSPEEVRKVARDL
jgi:8-hydroxy-5-deazaflavin:NADPH oxidoreductase